MDNTQGKIRFGASSAPHKLKLIMLIVNRDKVEFYTDFLQDFEVNMQAVFPDADEESDFLRICGIC